MTIAFAISSKKHLIYQSIKFSFCLVCVLYEFVMKTIFLLRVRKINFKNLFSGIKMRFINI